MAQARRLRRASGRNEAGCFLVEGPLQLQEALISGFKVREVFVGEDAPAASGAEEAAEAAGARVSRVSSRIVKTLSETTTPQGIVSVVEVPRYGFERLSHPSMVVLLADVRDPGNAGTLVRSSAAARADAIVFPRGTVDPFSPKTVRAAAGALFQVPLLRAESADAALAELKELGLVGIAADSRGEVSAYEADLTRPFVLVLGNEAWGLPDDLADLIDERVTIPMPGPTESLNVGIAGSILLFEAVRQRVPRSVNHGALSSKDDG